MTLRRKLKSGQVFVPGAMNSSKNVLGNVYMVGALSILRTTLFLTRTFVLVQSNLMHLPTIRTEAAKGSFYYHGSMVFNSYCQGGGVSKEICGTVRLPV